jgi:hypothetical protein
MKGVFHTMFDGELRGRKLTGRLGALGAGWQSVVASGQAVRKRTLLWQLQPLWSVLHQLAPGVELVYGQADVDFRLRRRVLEIEDALLEMEDRAPMVSGSERCGFAGSRWPARP